MGRRTQFPVRYYLCSTIHRIQGDTVPLLATEMSTTKNVYKMWQKEQFAVLVSRVHECADIILVGSREETRAAIERILLTSSKWDNLIDHFLNVLNVAVHTGQARHIDLCAHPFLPIYRELPSTECGYVYLLISLSTISSHYIGETDNIQRCVRDHNCGYGASDTKNTNLHPWGVFAFVFGFEQDMDDGGRGARRQFCNDWRGRARLFMGVEEVYTEGQHLADDWIQLQFKLTVVKCGQIANRQ